MMSLTSGVCTIIAKNYISFSRTLFQSFQKQHPDIKCYALIIDEWKDYIKPSDERFEILSLRDMSIPDVNEMTFKYDITELSTAVKPFLLEYLFVAKGHNRLLYLDPDIFVTGSLERLFNNLNEYDFIITPHLDTDYPNDGLLPDDRHILISGVFNLGFFGIRKSQNSALFLKWWQQKLQTKCLIDHAAGYFVDQRFIDLAITLFTGFHFEKDTGYNVAYWNMHSRRLSNEEGRWKCNGSTLYFFHFSAYKLEKPDLISRHSTRFEIKNRPDVKSLFNEYHQLLIDNGYLKTYQWPYTFNSFEDGEEVLYETRVSYRKALAAGIRISSPFNSCQNLDKQLPSKQKYSPPIFFLIQVAYKMTPPFFWEFLKSLKRKIESTNVVGSNERCF